MPELGPMTGKLDEWFDELSEEWVSQPRGSSPRSSAQGNSSRLSQRGSQSRIPLPKSTASNSPSSFHRRPSLAKSYSAGIRSLHAPLKDSTSKLNISRDKPPLKQAKSELRRTSTDSALPVQHGTVQHKARQSSVSGDENLKSTPEWKKRVLQGELKLGERKDLFSPMGLENVFQAPSTQKPPLKRRPNTFEYPQNQEMPSSPPPLPNATQNPSPKQQKFQLHSQKDSNEEGEMSSVRIGRSPVKDNNEELEKSLSLPSMVPDHTESSQQQDTNDTPETVIQTPTAIDNSTNTAEPKSRISSNKSELRNEGISVVSLPALHFGSDGRSPVETPERSLIGSRQPTSDPQTSKYSLNTFGRRKTTSFDQKSLPTPQLADWTSQSLPDDLSMGTQEFNTRGGFVNFRRGGDSVEGSFLRRELSSSIQRPKETTLPNSSSPSIIRHRTTQSAPSTQSSQHAHRKGSGSLHDSPPATPPWNVKQQAFSSPERPRSSGSPLKLFEKYDTFTNDRLIRRLSKFEESFQEASPPSDEQSHAKTLQGHEKPVLGPLPESPDLERKSDDTRPKSFGGGTLDEYEFSHEGSDDSRWSAPNPEANNDSTNLIQTESGIAISPTRVRRSFPISSRVQSQELDTKPDDVNSSDHWVGVAELQQIRQIQMEWKEGKRAPVTPKKTSQVKRRRISYLDDEGAFDARHKARPSLTSSTHSTMSVIGKRKDARYDSNTQLADEQVLASRRILRPRAPTPGQMKYGSHQRRDELSPTPSEGKSSPSRLIERVKELSSQGLPTSPTEALAADLATFALDVAQDITSGARKPSMTTGDFFEQAKAIMQHIRSKNRSPSFIEEEEEALQKPTLDHIDEASYEGSTVDRFSRPPSREGLNLRRLRAPLEVNPRIASHLRKFEDHDGVVEGLHIPNEPLSAAKPDQSHNLSIVSDPPNIRIISHAERILPDPVEKESDVNNNLSTGSGSSRTLLSSKASTNSTNQSGSAGGTRNKEFIAPEKVAHFLEKGVAGMTYDHSRKVWIKKRSSDPGLSGSDRSEEVTEDDPLGDIPDLSTDEMEEQARLRKVGAKALREDYNDQRQPPGITSSPPSSPPFQEDVEQRPDTESSLPSHRSTIETGAAKTETRATSPDHLEANTKPQEPLNMDQQLSPEKNVVEVEHEISILEGRASATPVRPRKHQQPRVVTVSFSSPVADSREPSFHDMNEYGGYDVDSDLDLASSPERSPSPKSTCKPSKKKGQDRRGRRHPVAQDSYSTRQISRIDEQEEMSFHESLNLNHEVSFNVILHTPRRIHLAREEEKSIIKLPSPSRKQLDATFQLTPLPDFTFNQSDELQPINVTRVPQSKGLLCAKDVEDRFSFAIKDLVRKITDIEPFEPYWDYLRRLDLGNRNLESLHMLNEFCGRVEELNVSGNTLAQLNGVPTSLRVLSARGNALSNLTAWGHLQNLQYLDISGNDISSLANLQGLFHLRELRADDNAIEDINGLAGLNGLLRLRLRQNGIQEVDLRNLGLHRLEELDLKENRIYRIEGLHELTKLRRLHLGSNNMTDFGQASSQQLALEYLDLSRNSLSSFDASHLPRLQKLNLDRNHISKISNVGDLACLLSLSWRDQTEINSQAPLELDIHSAQETRVLQLSENKITCLEPKSTFLNLQHLVLASAGLLKLSVNFGCEMPNLRILNLNHNALKDLKPLVGIKKLSKLQVAGNRILRLRRTSAVLAHFGNTLEEFDCRANPLTAGFYAPTTGSVKLEKRIVVQGEKTAQEVVVEEDDMDASLKKYSVADQDAQEDERYYSRLDDEMALKRKAYELLVHAACKKLRSLDGLPCYGKVIDEKDRNWQRLVELGVLKKVERVG